MSDPFAPAVGQGQSRVGLLVVVLLVLLVGLPVLLFCGGFVGLTVLGRSLESQFDEVGKAVEDGGVPAP